MAGEGHHPEAEAPEGDEGEPARGPPSLTGVQEQGEIAPADDLAPVPRIEERVAPAGGGECHGSEPAPGPSRPGRPEEEPCEQPSEEHVRREGEPYRGLRPGQEHGQAPERIEDGRGEGREKGHAAEDQRIPVRDPAVPQRLHREVEERITLVDGIAHLPAGEPGAGEDGPVGRQYEGPEDKGQHQFVRLEDARHSAPRPFLKSGRRQAPRQAR